MNWFIMAAGKADRCGGKCKQLFKVDGEKIGSRTVRLINEVDRDASVYIVGRRPELLEIGNVTMVIPTEGKCLAASMYNTFHYWGLVNCILMGDVIYSKKVISDIYNYTGEPVVFGKWDDGRKFPPERYALKFGIEYAMNIIEGLSTCIGHPLENEVPCCLTSRFWRWIGRGHRTRGPWGFLYWKCGGAARVATSVNMVEITDEQVCDIDTIEELFDYGRKYGHRVSIEGS